MSTDRITRLQSLLDRIKKNAALPKRSLGSNLFVGGTFGARTDIATGPAVPAASLAHARVQSDVAARAPLPPVAPAQAAAHQPAPAAARTPTLAGAARVPTMSGGTIKAPVAPEAPAKLPSSPQAAAKPPSPPVVTVKSPSPPEVIEELDFDDAGVVNITSDGPPEISSVEVSHVVSVEEPVEVRAKPATDSDADDLRWTEPPTQDQPPPDSSPRQRAAASLDEALAEAAAEADSVVPIKTPPPESGRQPMDGVYATPMPERSAADFIAMPTAEQLGETLELEAPTSAELELDLTAKKSQRPREELEFELPPRPSVLEPPAREELPTLTMEASEPRSRHRAPEQSQILNLPDDGDTIEMAAITADAAAPSTDRDEPPLTPELTSRRAQGQAVVPQFVFAARKFAPSSFAELLDASLKLTPGR